MEAVMRTGSPLATLREYAAVPAPTVDVCEVCAMDLPPSHDHRLHVETKQLLCVCDVCGTAPNPGATPWRAVRRRVVSLGGTVGEADWLRFNLPVDLAYFVVSSSQNHPVAYFPSALGAVESVVDDAAWTALRARSSAVEAMQPDVEALLVHRTPSGARRSYLVSIDVCYRLVGKLRKDWRGFGGGPDTWVDMAGFLEDLERNGGHG
jgi:hypothetical protein